MCLRSEAGRPDWMNFGLLVNCLLWEYFGKLQGCQMVYFQTKNPDLGKFKRTLDWKMLIYFMVIWNILETFGIFYDHLVHFLLIWYGFGILYREKSGNPERSANIWTTYSHGTSYV
jgi:hypothetical protein